MSVSSAFGVGSQSANRSVSQSGVCVYICKGCGKRSPATCCRALTCCDVVWCGAVWRAVAWCAVVWCGVYCCRLAPGGVRVVGTSGEEVEVRQTPDMTRLRADLQVGAGLVLLHKGGEGGGRQGAGEGV